MFAMVQDNRIFGIVLILLTFETAPYYNTTPTGFSWRETAAISFIQSLADGLKTLRLIARREGNDTDSVPPSKKHRHVADPGYLLE